jgi:threonyl-tRNA synthetase
MNPSDPLDPPDHRKLGRQLGIFLTDELLGAGLPLWLPAGAAVRAALERYIVEEERLNDYQHVYSPELGKRELYERSGHWQHYRDDMYPPMRVGHEEVVLRPMNCPHHVLVYQAQPRRRRELPLRIAELATQYRFERSGVVGGLSRVRRMTLNDGHVFCPEELIGEEVASILAMTARAYRALGLPPPRYRLSRRGEGGKYVDGDEMWATAEAELRAVLDAGGYEYVEAEGEAAFYGPKIDLQVTDPQGRDETLSTVQIDFHLPRQFELVYVASEEERRPVMIHRSIVSTMERMVAHLLEVHNGALPVWLSPIHCMVMPVVDDAVEHAARFRRSLIEAGLRAELDDRDATLAARVRDAGQRRVPYVAVIGRREAQAGTVSLRLRDGRQLDPLTTDDAVRLIAAVDGARSLELTPA